MEGSAKMERWLSSFTGNGPARPEFGATGRFERLPFSDPIGNVKGRQTGEIEAWWWVYARTAATAFRIARPERSS